MQGRGLGRLLSMMRTKQDYAYQVIKGRITAGDLLPGQRIVVNRLGHEIGTSAIPVREALLRLEAEGLVTLTPHIGAVVSLITGETIKRTLESMAVLEGYATRLALPRASEILDALKHDDAMMAAALEAEDWEAFSAGNRKFHFTIYGVCDNDILTNSIQSLWGQLDSYLSAAAFYLMPDRAQGSINEHHAIMDMLANTETDPLQLELAAREHKLNTARRLQLQDRRFAPSLAAAASR